MHPLPHPSRRYLTFRYDNVVDQAPAVGIHHAPRARVDDCLYVPAPMQVGHLFLGSCVVRFGQGLRARWQRCFWGCWRSGTRWAQDAAAAATPPLLLHGSLTGCSVVPCYLTCSTVPLGGTPSGARPG